jgi:hypothetical protein
MDNCLGSLSTESKNDILDKNIFGNSDIKFKRNPLFSNRFLKIIYLKQTIYGTKTIKPVLKIRLYIIDERNWISEWAKLK